MTACTCDCRACKNCVDKQPEQPETEKVVFSMWISDWERQRYIEFYQSLMENYRKVNALVYSDIKERFNGYHEEEYAKLLRAYSDPSDIDPHDAGSNASDRVEQDFLMHYQYHFSQLVNLYHNFEQHIRMVMYKAFNHRLSTVRTKAVMSEFATKFGDIKEVLQVIQYPLGANSAWQKIVELNKIANTYKHGDGGSAQRLDKSFFVTQATRLFNYEEERTPQEEREYVNRLSDEEQKQYLIDKADVTIKRELTTSLEITLRHDKTPYETYVNAIMEFWKTFPEHLNVSLEGDKNETVPEETKVE